MASSKAPLREGETHSPPPSYDSVMTHASTGDKEPSTKSAGVGGPESGFVYPPGYSAVPLQQTQYQIPGTYTGSQPSLPQYYYPPQFPQAATTVIPVPTNSGQVNYVIVNQPGSSVVQTYGDPLRPQKPKNYMWLSLLTCLCVNCMFGILALAFSCRSDAAYVAGETERARQYGKYAFLVNVIGILISAIFTLLFFFVSI